MPNSAVDGRMMTAVCGSIPRRFFLFSSPYGTATVAVDSPRRYGNGPQTYSENTTTIKMVWSTHILHSNKPQCSLLQTKMQLQVLIAILFGTFAAAAPLAGSHHHVHARSPLSLRQLVDKAKKATQNV